MPDTPTPADELRAAAQLIRERLMPVTEAPWTRWTEQESVPGWDGFIVIGDDAPIDADECNPIARFYTEEDARWALLMHPGVGEALADWLETAAEYYAPGAMHPTHVVRALVVARAVLGGAS
jgi:hypothetical protein